MERNFTPRRDFGAARADSFKLARRCC